MPDQIYNCPFCGSSNLTQGKTYTVGIFFRVKCADCGAEGPNKVKGTDKELSKDEAIRIWNWVAGIVSLDLARNPR